MAHIDVTDNTFEDEVLKSDKVVLVDFWAGWCMPCQMLGPIIEEVAEEIGDKAKVCKVNVDESKETASKYGIMSIPAVFIFKGGNVVEELVGLRQKDEYLAALNKHSEG